MASGFIKRKMEGWHLLWELPAGTTEFPAQTLNINLTDYDAIKVKMKVYQGAEDSSYSNLGNKQIQTFYVPVYSTNHSTYAVSPNNSIFSTNATLYLMSRTIRANSTTGVAFGDGLSVSAAVATATAAVVSTRMVPYKIWGQKKIL